MIGDDTFVLVDKKDVKSKDEKLGAPASGGSLRVMASIKGGQKPVYARLVTQYVTIGAAASAVSTPVTLSPIGVADYSAYAGLYDLCRVAKIEVHFRVGGTAAINGSADAALAWDPANPGAYANVEDVLTAQKVIGPLALLSQTTAVSSNSFSKNGYHKMAITLKPTRLTVDTLSSLVGGGWFGTSSTAAIAGYLKPYVQSLGAANVATLVYWVVYTCEFKSRT